jgi:hypothetical protein
MNETDVIQIKVRDGDTINLSLHNDGIWMSLFKQMSYASTMLTQKQATELRDALNALLRGM